MACDTWRDKINAYSDAELSAEGMRAMAAHLRTCASCSSDLLSRLQLKRAIKTAGSRFVPDLAFKQKIQSEIQSQKVPASHRKWLPWLEVAAAAAIIVLLFVLLSARSSLQQRQAFAELADLHVATLASANPVDVISTDRHTVKPWFQGKIPFAFNIPELSNTPFTLEGGRLAYLDQSPGAQLIFKSGNHRISAFIFQDRTEHPFPAKDTRSKRLTFNLESWSGGGLRYFLIGDADPSDIHKLSELLRSASQS
jgi:anti-sigma factor RsiW